MKKCEKFWKSVKNYETILPFSCCPLVFPWIQTAEHAFRQEVLGLKEKKAHKHTVGIGIIAKLIPQTILLCNVIDYTN